GISFHLDKGEILGVFGIIGSGRTEMARLLFGIEKKDSGKITINGKITAIRHPIDAVNMKMGYVTEDRRGEGLAIRLNVCRNITMPFFKRLAKFNIIDLHRETEKARELIAALNIKTPGIGTITENLSGGNQQKIVISKWIGSESEILIFDEPTRGIDVGAKAEVYRLMEKLSLEGKSIIMISSELPEILAMSDRLLVFRDGAIAAEFTNVRELKEEDVLRHAIATGTG
ncbi:MAG: ATP-binding cassette domain-containing protein, partial [Treponema sp.]|nr:ATP-binding cassette domain-containing protein [Treponema sp.]